MIRCLYLNISFLTINTSFLTRFMYMNICIIVLILHNLSIEKPLSRKSKYDEVQNIEEANLNLINFGCVILALLTST